MHNLHDFLREESHLAHKQKLIKSHDSLSPQDCSTKPFLWHTNRTRLLTVTQKQSPALSYLCLLGMTKEIWSLCVV